MLRVSSIDAGANMSGLIKAIAGTAPPHPHGPWPRRIVDADTWSTLAEQLAAGRWALAGMWGEAGAVSLALIDSDIGGTGRSEMTIATLPCPQGKFPSIALHHAPAHRLERTISDLFGLEPAGAPDDRRWLDYGRWGVRYPLGACTKSTEALQPYAFLGAEGEGLHQIPVGPVHAGIIEPGHFRFTANGETVVRLEERLGYTHKGIESLMAGAPIDRAARLAARVSGDSTVAFSIAFARAVEE